VLAFTGREDLDRFVLAKPEVGLRMIDFLADRLGRSKECMAEIAHKEVLSRLAKSRGCSRTRGWWTAEEAKNYMSVPFTRTRVGVRIP
jgi:CRP-like cAMP-binding protein